MLNFFVEGSNLSHNQISFFLWLVLKENKLIAVEGKKKSRD